MIAITDKPLSDKRQAFVNEYCINGHNATQAYKKAYPGCNGGWDKLCSRLMGNDGVKAAIKAIDAKKVRKYELNRQGRQQFWLDVQCDTKANMADRLRASQLCGQSQGDFITLTKDMTEQKDIVLTPEQQTAADTAIAAYHRSYLKASTSPQPTGAAPVAERKEQA